MTVFSDDYRDELTEKIKQLPEGARDHTSFNSLVENKARAEFRDLWQQVRPPAKPEVAEEVAPQAQRVTDPSESKKRRSSKKRPPTGGGQ